MEKWSSYTKYLKWIAKRGSLSDMKFKWNFITSITKTSWSTYLFIKVEFT